MSFLSRHYQSWGHELFMTIHEVLCQSFSRESNSNISADKSFFTPNKNQMDYANVGYRHRQAIPRSPAVTLPLTSRISFRSSPFLSPPSLPFRLSVFLSPSLLDFYLRNFLLLALLFYTDRMCLHSMRIGACSLHNHLNNSSLSG